MLKATVNINTKGGGKPQSTPKVTNNRITKLIYNEQSSLEAGERMW